MNGVFAIAKPAGISSAKLVGSVKSLFSESSVFASDLKIIKSNVLYNFKQQYPKKEPSKKVLNKVQLKVGHGGTLDVEASGVLVIGIGSGTKKLQKYLNDCVKTYEADAILGASTTSGDHEGEVLSLNDVRHINKEEISELVSKFTGDICQTPPIFSAIKINGMSLYEYARKGIPLPKGIKSRDVKVFNLSFDDEKFLSKNHNYKLKLPEKDENGKFVISELARISNLNEDQLHYSKQYVEKFKAENPDKEIIFPKPKPLEETDDFLKTVIDPEYIPPMFNFKTTVSSGTYIRSLISDFGKSLDSSAYMTRLVRSQQGEWELEKNVFKVDHFTKYNEAVWGKVLKKVLGSEKPQVENLNIEELLIEINEKFLAENPDKKDETYDGLTSFMKAQINRGNEEKKRQREDDVDNKISKKKSV